MPEVIAPSQTENKIKKLNNAALPRRLAALVYDTLVLAGVSIVYAMIGFEIKQLIFGAVPQGELPRGGPVLFIGWMLVLIGFYVYFWHKAGQTIGMRAWRLRLIATTRGEINSDHSTTLNNPSINQCLLRCLLATLSFLAFGLGYFWCLIDRDSLTFHDRFSNTRVVVLPKKTSGVVTM